MKFEKLTDTKIRISISSKDMEKNHLSAENIFSNSADSQKLLDTMIARAEKEIGFKPEDSKLLVEAIVLANNECVFTITKLQEEKICCPINANAFIFRFDEFDDFINLCTFLNNFNFLCLKDISKNFSLVYCKNAYYLKFVEIGNSSIVLDYIKTLFNEFGKDVSCSIGIDGVLNEYGKVIFAKNAILRCLNCFST